MRPYHLFVAQSLDRIERGGFPRGIKAEENSNRGAEQEMPARSTRAKSTTANV